MLRPGERLLTLSGIPDSMLADYGQRAGATTAISYRCTDHNAVLEPLAEIRGPPKRLLNEGSLRYHLGLIRDRQSIEPVSVYRARGAPTATLVDGVHRWRLSLALGYVKIPCRHLTKGEAAEYGL
jgi:hypothetical protein